MITRIDSQSRRRSEATGLPLRMASIRLNDSGEGLPWEVELAGTSWNRVYLRTFSQRHHVAKSLTRAQAIARRWVNDGELP